MITRIEFYFDEDTAIEYEMSLVPRVGETINFIFGERGRSGTILTKVREVRWAIVDEHGGDQADIATIWLECSDERLLSEIKRKYLKNLDWLKQRRPWEAIE